MLHEKDVQLLEDKVSKMDIQLQKSIKEKTAALSANTQKDREISELTHKETALKARVIGVF